MTVSSWLGVVTIAVLIRTLVGVWGYSGFGHAPMFGDFEAQRHWMEITTSLPISDWYRHTPENDLMYWGLDYPPLTAYISFIFGKLAIIVCPNLVELFTSRGHETVEGKVFMRATVILMDILVVLPSILTCCSAILAYKKGSGKVWTVFKVCYCLSCLLVPGLLLIDHGHFQYNGVCLALALFSALLILNDQDIVGSVLFCLSLNFKQMSLYYAPVFFFCLLRKCFSKGSVAASLVAVAKLGATVVATFTALWFPFCVYHSAEETCVSSLLHVLSRQFPFSRGIFEDKVANLWYASSVLVDFRQFLTQPQLVICSLTLTLILLSPVCYCLLASKVSTERLLLSLVNGSLAFFLASYQVHEKSILLALFPAAFLVLSDPLFVTWLQVLGTFTMFPLLKRDGLQMPYLSCTVVYVCLVALLVDEEIKIVSVSGDRTQIRNSRVHSPSVWTWMFRLIVKASFAGMALLHLLELLVAPPARYPDLYPALFSIFGAVNLSIAYIYGVAWQVRSSLTKATSDPKKTC